MQVGHLARSLEVDIDDRYKVDGTRRLIDPRVIGAHGAGPDNRRSHHWSATAPECKTASLRFSQDRLDRRSFCR